MKNKEDLRGTLSKHRHQTFINSPSKLLESSKKKQSNNTKGKI